MIWTVAFHLMLHFLRHSVLLIMMVLSCGHKSMYCEWSLWSIVSQLKCDCGAGVTTAFGMCFTVVHCGQFINQNYAKRPLNV